MTGFEIIINSKKIMSDDIYNFLKRGKRSEAKDYIIEKTSCTAHDADELLQELIELVIPKKKEERVYTHEHSIDLTKADENRLCCHLCGSNSIVTSRRDNEVTIPLILERVIYVNVCLKCGYEWPSEKSHNLL